MKKKRTQSLLFWSNFDHPLSPEEGQNRKNNQLWQKTSAIGLTKYVKIKSFSPLPLPGKTQLLFVQFELDFQVWLLFLVPRLHFWRE